MMITQIRHFVQVFRITFYIAFQLLNRIVNRRETHSQLYSKTPFHKPLLLKGGNMGLFFCAFKWHRRNFFKGTTDLPTVVYVIAARGQCV